MEICKVPDEEKIYAAIQAMNANGAQGMIDTRGIFILSVGKL